MSSDSPKKSCRSSSTRWRADSARSTARAVIPTETTAMTMTPTTRSEIPSPIGDHPVPFSDQVEIAEDEQRGDGRRPEPADDQPGRSLLERQGEDAEGRSGDPGAEGEHQEPDRRVEGHRGEALAAGQVEGPHAVDVRHDGRQAEDGHGREREVAQPTHPQVPHVQQGHRPAQRDEARQRGQGHASRERGGDGAGRLPEEHLVDPGVPAEDVLAQRQEPDERRRQRQRLPHPAPARPGRLGCEQHERDPEHDEAGGRVRLHLDVAGKDALQRPDARGPPDEHGDPERDTEAARGRRRETRPAGSGRCVRAHLDVTSHLGSSPCRRPTRVAVVSGSSTPARTDAPPHPTIGSDRRPLNVGRELRLQAGRLPADGTPCGTA